MDINWFDWLGYFASLVVLISLLMSSIIKLRWINLMGSFVFSLYGFLIGALPVGFMNMFIAFINIYYLFKIYTSKEYFKILPIEGYSQYFKHFMDFYRKDIEKYSNVSQFNIKDNDVSFYVLRNMVPAGIFIASPYDENTLNVHLDFVIPEYRDFKIGRFIYENMKDYFLSKGYSKFIVFSSDDTHIDYLKRMGFEKKSDTDNNYYLKTISEEAKIA